MRLPIPPHFDSLLFFLLLGTAQAAFDCNKVVAKGAEFHLSKLGGLHHVSWVRESESGLGVKNTTFNINLCAQLDYKGSSEAERKKCLPGTRICGVREETFDDTGNTEILQYIPIVRDYTHDGANLNNKATRLSTSESHSDSQKEGLRLKWGGGKFQDRPQQAIIEFLCKKDDEDRRRRLGRRDDDGNDEDKGKDKEKEKPEWKAARTTDDGVGGTIEFLSYKEDTLRLDWHTPFGCEDAKDAPADSGSGGGGGWGFFSWLFFLGFIGLLLYFVVSAWVNYNRYGAQGWDLIPHADTLRDLPYILGDWWRKIVGTVSGGGSRGGYSAV